MRASARPSRPNTLDVARCWRCGIDFRPYRQHVGKDDPCRDCREALRADGDETIWDVRTLKLRAEAAA